MQRELKISTAFGILIARLREEDGCYPGIDILLERDGVELMLALVESDQNPLDAHPPYMNLLLYGDCEQDEPSSQSVLHAPELDAYFAAVANGARELN
jgi:hypothetical protein